MVKQITYSNAQVEVAEWLLLNAYSIDELLRHAGERARIRVDGSATSPLHRAAQLVAWSEENSDGLWEILGWLNADRPKRVAEFRAAIDSIYGRRA